MCVTRGRRSSPARASSSSSSRRIRASMRPAKSAHSRSIRDRHAEVATGAARLERHQRCRCCRRRYRLWPRLRARRRYIRRDAARAHRGAAIDPRSHRHGARTSPCRTLAHNGSIAWAVAAPPSASAAPGGHGLADNAPELQALPDEMRNLREAVLSPDGSRVAGVSLEGGRSDIWVDDVRQGGATRLTHSGSNASPVLVGRWADRLLRRAHGRRV